MTSDDKKKELIDMGFVQMGFFYTYPNSHIKISWIEPIVNEDINEWNNIISDLRMKIRDLNIDKLIE